MKNFKYTAEEIACLDSILQYLNKADIGKIVLKDSIYERFKVHIHLIDSTLKILESEGYVNNGISNIVSLTPDGRRFINRGGYKLELELFEKEKEEENIKKALDTSVAKSSRANNYVSIVTKVLNVLSMLYVAVDILLNFIQNEGVFNLLVNLILS